MNKLAIQNKILSNVRLGEIDSSSDKRLEFYPFNNLEHLIEESINVFSRAQVWNWSSTITDLGYFPSFTEYYLSDFDINHNRVKEIFFFDGTEKTTINRCSYKEFRQLYGGLTDTGKPQVFCLNNNILRFYPIQDKDYGIKIRHYQHLSPLLTESDEVDFIPEMYQSPIPDYVTSALSALIDKSNAESQHRKALTSLSKVKHVNQQYISKKNIMPSKIRW